MSSPSGHVPFTEDECRALDHLGAVVRGLRAKLGLTRARLAERSGLSLRFLAQLEAGEGNISYLRLRRVAEALGTDTAALVERAQGSGRPITLLGMRGAGKSSVGPVLAHSLRVPFLELDEMVQELGGMSLEQIFELQGESYYRQLERDALEGFFSEGTPAVLAAGGGIVTVPESLEILRRRSFTVWLRATPQEHWNRVLAQGDRRPMRDRPDAMAELERLWTVRSRHYARADLTIDTSHQSVDEVASTIRSALADAGNTLAAERSSR